MLCCLNPDCDREINPDHHSHCQNCGTPLVHLLFNRFKVIEPIGRGGFGKTYLAEDTHKLSEPCVVKQLAYQAQGTWAAKKAVELFEQEAQRLQQLGENPQIPTLLAYFQEGGLLYLVQQFIEGQDLLKELQQRGEFGEAQIKQLLFDLLPVLQFTHERGIIHRDIKPPNIMRRYKDGKLILIDFGVSKLISQTTIGAGSVGSILGSYGYAPLEQMQDGKAVFASDLFAIGVTCFNLLTGMSPIQLQTNYGYSWVSNWQQYLSSPISGQLKAVLDRLMQTDLQNRYQSASEVLNDLQSQTVPPTVPPPSPSPIPPPTPLPQTFIGNVPPTSQPHKRSMFMPALIVGTGVATVAAVAMITSYPKATSQQPQPAVSLTTSSTPVIANQLTAEELVKLGDDKSSKGDKQGAISNYTKAIELKPNYAIAHKNRGFARVDLFNRQGKLDILGSDKSSKVDKKDTITDLNKAIELNPEFADAYIGRSMVRYALNDKQGAIADVNKVIELNPELAEAYVIRGLVRLSFDDKQGTLTDTNKAIEIKPEFAEAFAVRGLVRLSLNDKQGAIADVNKAIELDPKLAGAYGARSLVRLFTGDKQGAIADSNKAIGLDLKLADAYVVRGMAHSRLGNNQSGISDLNKAIALKPDNTFAYISRGAVLTSMGDKKRAIEDFQKAASLYLEQGDTKNYQASLDKIKELQQH
jgi:serine/threonine protein kinase/Flp pilus assembly protein TadD